MLWTYGVVRWNGVFSRSFYMLCGVRQGDVLSTVLLFIYVDDLIVKLSEKWGRMLYHSVAR